MIAAAHWGVFRPLLLAREEVIALAAGQVAVPVPRRAAARGLRELFEALALLRARLSERDALDWERQAMDARLKRQAETGGLTGLLNRRVLEDVGRGRDGPVPFGGRDAALILLDVDRFEAINDAHGHAAGDAVLVEIAQRMRPLLRRTDVLARFGGEEFAVLLPGRDASAARGLAEALREDEVRLPGGGRVAVSASFGVATGTRDAAGWPALLAAADAALYRAKRGGRDRVVLEARGDTVLEARGEAVPEARAFADPARDRRAAVPLDAPRGT